MSSETLAARPARRLDLASPSLLGLASAAVALVAAGVALRTPWLPLQEADAVQGARDLGAESARAGVLWQLLLWIPAHVLSAGAFLAFAKAASALAWVALVVPAYALARRAVEPRAAAVVAGLSLLCSGSVYGTAVLPDALALLLATGALAASAGERRGPAVALAVGAALARPWFAPLPFVLWWAATPRERRPSLRAWPGASLVAVAAGMVYAGYAVSDAHSVGSLLRSGLGSLGLAALAVGVVPAVLAWAGPEGPLRRLLAPATLAAASAGALAGAGGPIRAEERAALVLVPLLLALAAAALRGFDSGRVRLAALGVVVTTLPIPWPLPKASAGVLSGALWRHLDSHPLLILVAAVLALLPLVVPARRVAALAAALLVATSAVAWSDVAHESRALGQGVPLPHSQIDDAVGRDTNVTWALTGNADPRAVAEAELWNRSLRRVVRVDPVHADPSTGVLDPRRAELALSGIELTGTEIARIPLGTITRAGGPMRAAEVIEGRYPDGWSGFETTYTRFAGPQRNSTLEITVSRATWTGPDKPAQVIADAVPLGGEPFAERTTSIRAGQQTALSVPVPPPPFRVTVHVTPTFSPAELSGTGDVRQLGAVLTFTYKR